MKGVDMKTAKDRLLLMAGADTKTALTDAIREFFDLEILEAETENRARRIRAASPVAASTRHCSFDSFRFTFRFKSILL